jgi:hypothetical protein
MTPGGSVELAQLRSKYNSCLQEERLSIANKQFVIVGFIRKSSHRRKHFCGRESKKQQNDYSIGSAIARSVAAVAGKLLPILSRLADASHDQPATIGMPL